VIRILLYYNNRIINIFSYYILILIIFLDSYPKTQNDVIA